MKDAIINVLIEIIEFILMCTEIINQKEQNILDKFLDIK